MPISSGCCSRRDHPRIRGEHEAGGRQVYIAQGSSPHSRGTLSCLKLVMPAARIIPAFAGNTLRRLESMFADGDHPRIRGEHTLTPFFFRANLGSSPHLRGTQHILTAKPIQNGIIPAFAGNTEDYVRLKKMAKDHPRICGEHA